MPATPSKTGRKIDAMIDRLNSRWDLQIPRLHGVDARKAGEGEEVARKCSSRIRALCWKNFNVDAIIDDFEERAAQPHSGWVYKPGQTRGTLQSLPVSKSFIKQNAISRSRLEPEKRLHLTAILLSLLEEEYNLACQSDSYQRTSFTSAATTSTSNNTSFSDTRPTSTPSFVSAEAQKDIKVKTPSAQKMKPAVLQDTRSSSSRKRGATQITTPTAKKSKSEGGRAQFTLSQCGIKKQSVSISSSVNQSCSFESTRSFQFSAVPSNPAERSFDTTTSHEPDRCFSDDDLEATSSNDTSILGDESGGRESLFSGCTQAFEDLAAQHNNQHPRRAEKVITRPVAELLTSLASTGPFNKQETPKTGALDDQEFWYTFELHRLSRHLACDVEVLTNDVTKACGTENPSFESFWMAIRDMCRTLKLSTPPKSHLKDFTHRENSYVDTQSGRSVSFSARLDFTEAPHHSLFSVKFNPIALETSCRFHRKFGADRFLVLDIPSFAPEYPMYLPARLKPLSPDEIHQYVFDWLTLNDLFIAGRTWRAFYVEPKTIPKKKRKIEGARQNIHLFAVDGYDFARTMQSANKRHSPITIHEFLQWHIPLAPNSESTDLKLFARMHLGLSKTIATVILEPSQFRYVADKKPTDYRGRELDSKEIMTDGCARISYALASAVWRQIDPKESLPSAFQGRIGGAKGLWIVDYQSSEAHNAETDYWIEVSDSQLKIKPHPSKRMDADIYQRTFEVVKCSKPCDPANLNTQLITILSDRGVPRKSFRDLFMAELDDYYKDLHSSIQDPLELFKFRNRWHGTRSAKFEIEFSGSMPDSKSDELDMLLEAGFHPQENKHIEECLKPVVTQGLVDREEKLGVRVPYSTNLFCVPDLFGVLKEGEIQLNFSKAVSYFPDHELIGRKVLVARNPAHLASDIQAVTAVYREELRHYKDVAIFSIQGEMPLAGMLSGGDYDGDQVFVTWDQTLTASFDNVSPSKLPSKTCCDIVTQTQLIREVFNIDKPSMHEVDRFLRKCCGFNGISSRLGEVTKLLDRLVYTNSQNMNTTHASQLAALAGYLVDSAKGGDSFSKSAWSKLKNDIVKRYRLNSKMDYADENATTSQRKDLRTGWCLNVLDYLKFDVVIARKDEILRDFNEQYRLDFAIDADLFKPINDAWGVVENAKGAQRIAGKSLLDDLTARIGEVYDRWKDHFAKEEYLKSLRDLPKGATLSDYKQLAVQMRSEIEAIEPIESDWYIYNEFKLNGGDRRSQWAQLRASCAYKNHYKGKLPWKTVGDELCFLKAMGLARRGVRVRPVVEYMRNYLKFDTKKYNRLAFVRAGSNGADDDDVDDEVV